MTFNPNAEINSDNTSRASGGGGMMGGGMMGRGGALALGGGGIGTLVIVIILMLMGVDPSALMGGATTGQTTTSQSQGSLTECKTGADANSNNDCLVQGTVESADSFWSQEAPQNGIQFQQPKALIFSGQVNTGCGAASASTGPFYCPADQTIYIDTSFYQELQSRFGSSGGQLAKEYVIAHEYGHHIQNLDGTMNKIDHNQTGPQSDSVRLELQADCYAGLWARHAATTTDDNGNTMIEPLTQQDVEDALSAASSVGDDHIQSDVAHGQVNPESWTHGSSAQRQKWFITGYNKGTYSACNTFAVNQV